MRTAIQGSKTTYLKKSKHMKKIIFLGIAWMTMISLSSYANDPMQTARPEAQDTTGYITLKGKVVDENTKEPVIFAAVFETGSSVGTVSNSDGDFILKIPQNAKNGTVSISYLGYKDKIVNVADLMNGNTVIMMQSTTIPINELVFKSKDPVDILRRALLKVKDNYSQKPEMETGFYRETIKQNRNYVSISEAILDIYNAGYKQGFDYDRVKIFKGRKSKDVKKMDTVLVKFQGGPRLAMFLDVVKNPGVLLDPEMMQYYTYTLTGIVSINDRQNYVIDFKQSKPYDYPLYEGKIYVDIKSEAITSVDFRITNESLPVAAQVLVKKKPATMKMEVLSGNYLVKYRLIDSLWCLNYVRSEVTFRSKWERKLFKSNITTMFEMAITDRDTKNIEKYSNRESVKISDVLADQVSAFEDVNFWGKYNYIKPDESIETAIAKINKKLKKLEQ